MATEITLRWPEPALTSADVALRPWHRGDAAALVEAWADPDVARWNPVPPATDLNSAVEWIVGSPSRLQEGLALDLVLDVGDTVVGEVGLSGFDHQRRAALVGYWLLPSERGAGLASSAVQMLADWAHDELDLAMLVARCAVDNIASHRVAQRAGFVCERNDGQGHDLWVSRG